MLAALLVIGVILGLVTAWGHSLSYLGSRWFTIRGRGTSLQMLVLAHVQLGLLALVGMPLAWPEGLAWDAATRMDWMRPALLGGLVLAVAQASLFLALKYVDASSVSPLLTLKIAVLAAATTLGIYTPAESIGGWAWLGVGLAIAGAIMIQGIGKPPPTKAWPIIFVMLVGYAFCDLSIVKAITAVCRGGFGLPDGQSADAMTRLHAGVFVATLLYAVTGVLSMLALPWLGSRKSGVWRDALAYAVPWTVAMVTLYGTFAMVGVVFGAVLQSTRALWSVLLGAWVGQGSDGTIETHHPTADLLGRFAAAAMMIAAVALFAWSRSG